MSKLSIENSSRKHLDCPDIIINCDDSPIASLPLWEAKPSYFPQVCTLLTTNHVDGPTFSTTDGNISPNGHTEEDLECDIPDETSPSIKKIIFPARKENPLFSQAGLIISFVNFTDSPIKMRYDFQELIGTGGGGEVCKVKTKLMGVELAMKSLKKNESFGRHRQRMIKEAELLSKLDHPHIVKVYEVNINDSNVSIIMEKGSHNLSSYRFRYDLLTNEFLATVFKQVFSALKYLHNKNIVHRDVKLDNVLVNPCNGAPNAKLIDFGIATEIGSDECKSLKGTAHYLCPEIFEGKCTDKSDMWSAGIMLYSLVFSRFPFSGSNLRVLRADLENEVPELNDTEKYKTQFDLQLYDLISKLLVKNPKFRLSAQEALNHPFILSYADIGLKGNLNDLKVQNMLSQPFLRGFFDGYYKYHFVPTVRNHRVRILFEVLDKGSKGFLKHEDFKCLLDSSVKKNQGQYKLLKALVYKLKNLNRTISYTEFVSANSEVEGFGDLPKYYAFLSGQFSTPLTKSILETKLASHLKDIKKDHLLDDYLDFDPKQEITLQKFDQMLSQI